MFRKCLTGPSTPVAYIENKQCIRKRKCIDFTMDDLDNDAEETDDEGFESKVVPNTNRSVPMRNCKKNVVYHMDRFESQDE